MPARIVRSIYCDPLDLIWLNAARSMGIRINRSADVNASWDGSGVLTIGTPETLDADDCLAQMILHEACHALCEGPESLSKPDWGLDSFDPAKKIHEHACLRLQAALADRHQMRSFFAATTIFRRYYDSLPDDPLADDGDPAVTMAQAAWQRACHGEWAEPLATALRQTWQIAVIVRDIPNPQTLWQACCSDRDQAQHPESD